MTHAPHPKPVIGLVGAPGSGKSFVARLMADEGCAVIDADRLAREAMQEAEVREQVVAWWPHAVTADGRIDRRALGATVFGDPEALRRLEGLIHPRVRARRETLRQRHFGDASVRAIVEDVPLLLEKNLDRLCDVLVFVDAPREVRLGRVESTRGWSLRDLEAREKQQLPLDSKRARADYVVDNGGDEAATRAQVRRLLSRIFHRRA